MVGYPKVKRIRDRKYLNSAKNRRCCVCNSPLGVVMHHMRIGGGMGLKTGDNFTIPLCTVPKSDKEPSCHWLCHNKDGEKAFYLRYGYKWGGDVESYANNLYQKYLDKTE